MARHIVFNFLVPGGAEKESSIHKWKLFEDGEGALAQSAVDDVAVASAERGQNELPEVLSLPHVDVVLHSDVVSVHLVAGDVREQLGQIHPAEKADGALPSCQV